MFYGGSSACPATGPGPSQRLALGVCVQPPTQPLTQQSSLIYRPRMGRDDSQRTKRQRRWQMQVQVQKKPKAKKESSLFVTSWFYSRPLSIPLFSFFRSPCSLSLCSLSDIYCSDFSLYFHCSTNNQTRRLFICSIHSYHLCLSRWLCLTQQTSPPTGHSLIL